MLNYIVITSILISLLIIIQLFSNLFVKKKTLMDALNENPEFKKMKEFYELLNKLNEDGTDQDTIPGGFGEYGYDVTNPIPVNTIFGNTAYLARLITLNDIKVKYERVGSTGSINIEHPVDIYNIFEDDKKIATLYISPYHKKNSDLAPKGFKIAQ